MGARYFPIPEDAERALPPPATLPGRASRFVLERFPVWPIVAFLAKKSVPQHRHSAWYMMGGIALFFFIIQLLTGILLMVYYRPAEPWASVQEIVNQVPFGNLIRSMHHWGANLMVLALFVHMFSTFFLKAYRPPRELTWISGLGLLGLTMAFGFSGYLLPWDDLSFFATRVGIAEVEKAPLIGGWIADLARGGPDVTVETIGRFYPLHVVVLPLLVIGLISAHLLFVQLQGVSEPDAYHEIPESERKSHKFFSEFLVAEIPIWLFIGALVAALAVIFPRALMPQADPAAPAPSGIKPEWYFLSQYQALKLFPGHLEFLGQLMLGVIPLAMVVVPFLDKSQPVDKRGKIISIIGMLGVFGLIVMTIWGWLS